MTASTLPTQFRDTARQLQTYLDTLPGGTLTGKGDQGDRTIAKSDLVVVGRAIAEALNLINKFPFDRIV